ncbi:MAG: hypothetical protein WC609_04105 [Candidatus Paceibacterota bacterium]|jgi:hypothetical protein
MSFTLDDSSIQKAEKLSDTNYLGNAEVRKAIEEAKKLGLGEQSNKAVGLANATASLDVAESLQMFQMVIENQTNKLIKSSDESSRKMVWLTCALVFVGAITAFATIAPVLKNFARPVIFANCVL